MIKYKTGGWRDKIERVEVERETKQFVVINGRLEIKRSWNWCYFDSWADAHSYLHERTSQKIESLRDRLAAAQKELAEIEGLQKPEE